MRLFSSASSATEVAPPDHYTGCVLQEMIADVDAGASVRIARTHFSPCARSHWHVDPLGYVLLAISGTGRVQRLDAPVVELRPGDAVIVEPGETHWCGAAADTSFVQLTIRIGDADGGAESWRRPVSEEQYLRTPGLID